MRHSYASLFYYVTWGVKSQGGLILPTAAEKLRPYIRKIITNVGMQARAVGISQNKIHLILKMPGKYKLSDLVGKIKEYTAQFSWERAYNAFTFHETQLFALKNLFHEERYEVICAPDVELLYHVTWATKNRLPLIPQTIEQKLYLHMKTLAHKRDIEIIAAGGIHNHIHILVNCRT